MVCEMCLGPTKNGSRYCSKECEQRHYSYIEISIPSAWVRNTVVRLPSRERYAIISSFAKRHSYKEDLVILRLERDHGIYIEKGTS